MIALPVGIALLAVGCAQAGPAPLSSAEPAAGGDLIFAIDTPYTTIDPNVTASAQDARAVRQIFDSLVAMDTTGKIVPWLATEWSVSADETEYTFTLREGVTFHDGTPFDAAAVCFNLDRIKNPESASIYAISLIGPYSSCAAATDTTAVVKLATPYAPLLASLSSPFLGMVSPTAASSMSLAEFAINPVGSGPFSFVSYTPNDRLILAANVDYDWPPATAKHTGRPLIDTLTLQIIPDATVRLGSLRSGSLHGVGNVPETEAATIKADSSLAFVAQTQSGSPFQLNFNTENPPFDDPELRRALRMGLNIDAAVQALYFGIYQRAWGPLSPDTMSYDPSVENSFSYDPKAAAAELDRLGWVLNSDGVRQKNGQTLTINYLENAPNREKRQDIAEFMRANLAEIGVTANIRLEQGAGITAAVQAADYDLLGLSLVNIDANVLYSLYSPQFRSEPGRTGFNFTRTDNAELAADLLSGQREFDQSKRAEFYSKVQQRVIDEALSIAVYVPTYTVALNGMDGITFDAEGYPQFYGAFLSR